MMQTEMNWDTDEILNWILNDEALYRATRRIRLGYQMKAFIRNIRPDYPDMKINISNVRWGQVVKGRHAE